MRWAGGWYSGRPRLAPRTGCGGGGIPASDRTASLKHNANMHIVVRWGRSFSRRELKEHAIKCHSRFLVARLVGKTCQMYTYIHVVVLFALFFDA